MLSVLFSFGEGLLSSFIASFPMQKEYISFYIICQGFAKFLYVFRTNSFPIWSYMLAFALREFGDTQKVHSAIRA